MSVIKIAIWNINSIRIRVEQLLEFIDKNDIDVVLLQETKCQNHDFPFALFASLGLNYLHMGQKSYNGVAIISKFPLNIELDILPSYDIDDEDFEARYIEATFTFDKKLFRVSSVYVPNGAQVLLPNMKLENSPRFLYKLNFYERLLKRLELIATFEDEYVLIGGDFNVARARIDLHSPDKEDGQVGFHPNERAWLERLIQSGFDDAFRFMHHSDPGYTWFDYRTHAFHKGLGWRIDYALISNLLKEKLVSCDVDLKTRAMQKTSDHAPLVCEFKF